MKGSLLVGREDGEKNKIAKTRTRGVVGIIYIDLSISVPDAAIHTIGTGFDLTNTAVQDNSTVSFVTIRNGLNYWCI